MSGVLDALSVAVVEWRGMRRTLGTTERRSFARWVARVHPEIASEFRGEPARFRATCQEVLRGVSHLHHSGIGAKTLAKYAVALSSRWLAIPDASRGTFRSFLEGVLAACPTERALVRYLRTLHGFPR